MRFTYKTNTQDYHAFGSIMAGRSFSNANYRFKWNGKEAEPELFEGCLTFEARIFDNRICRWLSTDPREGEYAWQSTYAYFSNCPIWQLDINGEGGPGKTHTVKPGESLSEIAKNNNTTVDELKAANKQIKWDTDAKRTGNKKDWVYEGEKLNLPSSNAEEVEKAVVTITTSKKVIPKKIEAESLEAENNGGIDGWEIAAWCADGLIIVFDVVTVPSGEAVPLIAARKVLWKVLKKGSQVGGALLLSKGRGKKGIWPEEYTKPQLKDIDWKLSDSELADKISGKNAKKGQQTPNGLMKKLFRDKRPRR